MEGTFQHIQGFEFGFSTPFRGMAMSLCLIYSANEVVGYLLFFFCSDKAKLLSPKGF